MFAKSVRDYVGSDLNHLGDALLSEQSLSDADYEFLAKYFERLFLAMSDLSSRPETRSSVQEINRAVWEFAGDPLLGRLSQRLQMPNLQERELDSISRLYKLALIRSYESNSNSFVRSVFGHLENALSGVGRGNSDGDAKIRLFVQTEHIISASVQVEIEKLQGDSGENILKARKNILSAMGYFSSILKEDYSSKLTMAALESLGDLVPVDRLSRLWDIDEPANRSPFKGYVVETLSRDPRTYRLVAKAVFIGAVGFALSRNKTGHTLLDFPTAVSAFALKSLTVEQMAIISYLDDAFGLEQYLKWNLWMFDGVRRRGGVFGSPGQYWGRAWPIVATELEENVRESKYSTLYRTLSIDDRERLLRLLANDIAAETKRSKNDQKKLVKLGEIEERRAELKQREDVGIERRIANSEIQKNKIEEIWEKLSSAWKSTDTLWRFFRDRNQIRESATVSSSYFGTNELASKEIFIDKPTAEYGADWFVPDATGLADDVDGQMFDLLWRGCKSVERIPFESSYDPNIESRFASMALSFLTESDDCERIVICAGEARIGRALLQKGAIESSGVSPKRFFYVRSNGPARMLMIRLRNEGPFIEFDRIDPSFWDVGFFQDEIFFGLRQLKSKEVENVRKSIAEEVGSLELIELKAKAYLIRGIGVNWRLCDGCTLDAKGIEGKYEV